MSEQHWYVVQTTPQGERKAVDELRRAGFRAYLPKRAVYHRRKDDRLPIKRWPAMVGYVFMRFPSVEDWNRLHRCQGVRGVLHLNGAVYRLPRKEVALVMAAQRAMTLDHPNAKAVRRAWIKGEKNARRALAAERFRPGARVYNAGANIMAKVLEVTKHGTIRAIIEGKDRDTVVEFSDLDVLRIDETSEAA